MGMIKDLNELPVKKDTRFISFDIVMCMHINISTKEPINTIKDNMGTRLS
jgi:hypothetical protein